MSKLFSLFFLLLGLTTAAQKDNAIRMYPTHWWTGMKDGNLQVILHGTNLQAANLTLEAYPGVRLLRVHKPENRNYLFADLAITPAAKPGTLRFRHGSNALSYKLQARRPGKGTRFAQGVTSKDFMYLIMPDRFANGNPVNDRLPGFADPTFSRDSMYFRHGGDLQGIQQHLDYLQDLGVTALWLNPVIENDMPRTSYHGYAFTDHYKVDARLGGDSAYKSLIDAMHARGMKMVQDAVYNHVGTEHWFVKDMPSRDWLHQWPQFTQTNYKDQVLFDPYASEADRKKMSDGWFVRSMPDLNHNNPHLARFLIQHALWTVEEFGIDGWRIDTYAYNDLEFMNRCNAALLAEYPKLTIFGETWVHGVPNQSFFVRNRYNLPYKSNQPGVTDFQTLWGITDALTKDFGWNEGVNRLYTTLAQDFVYHDPSQNVTFLDNHDISRFYSVVGEDKSKYKIGIGWLLTSRGTPQWYYGAEIGMTGYAAPDGLVRMDFPGGWAGDSASAFTAAGRNALQNELHSYVKRLAQYRKNSTPLQTGRLVQFYPEDAVYTYFRFDSTGTVMVMMNTAKEPRKVQGSRFAERTGKFRTGRDVVTGEVLNDLQGTIEMPPLSIRIMELK